MLKTFRKIDLKSLRDVKLSSTLTVLLLLMFNLLLLQLPLTKVFGYEYSVLNGVLLTFLAGLFTLRWKKKNNNLSPAFITFLFLIGILPLILSVIHSLFIGFCSFTDGLFFYLLLTFPSLIIGPSLALISIYLSERFSLVLFLLIFLMIASIPFVELFLNPQIYFYNPIIGYFPGSIYDEGLSADLKLFVYRLLNIIFFFGLITLTRFDRARTRIRINIAAIILTGALFVYFSPAFGFSTTRSSLLRVLNSEISSESIAVYYEEKSGKDEAEFLMLNAEYYFETLQKALSVVPAKKIEIFLFRNNEEKKLYFGSGVADVAKPWLYQVYLSKDSWESTLKHELAHVFSAEFGSTIFKLAANFNPSLIEGFATAQDPFRDEMSIDYIASLAINKMDKAVLESIFNNIEFFGSSSMITYTYSGSLIKYLIENYGIEKFKEIYRSGNYIDIYGISINKILDSFIENLNQLNTEKNEDRYNYYFGRLSIVQKVCPRAVGNMLRLGWEQFAQGEYDKARSVFGKVMNLAPNYSAAQGITESLAKQDSSLKAIELLNAFIPVFEGSPYYYLLRLRLADLLASENKYKEASEIYIDLSNRKPTIIIEGLALTRLKLSEAELLQEYLNSSDSLKFEILKELNKENYFYPSIPFMINLANSLDIDYAQVISLFKKTQFINDFYSAFANYRLSGYMIQKGDYRNARKMAALSLRFKNVNYLNELCQDNFEKAEWFYYNADEIRQQFSHTKR